ncbi:MAG: hypothetical protein KAT16_05740 [Candidatus Heimdallarchaeota archaeon]|nr:hypothetical protein [Candidatus Heimdallarchaeota archaeon]
MAEIGMVFIALASLISSILSLAVSVLLIYDWKNTRKQQRLEWGVGMLTYALGHFIFFLMNFITEQTEVPFLGEPLCTYLAIFPGCPNVSLLWLWVYINLGGAITIPLMLKGLLPFFTEKSRYIYGIPISFALIYGIGSFWYGLVGKAVEEPSIFMLGKYLGHIPETVYEIQKANMSWFIAICLIPVSFVIGFLFFMHYRELKKEELKGRPSLLISMHWFGYALILFIWPFGIVDPIFYLLFYSLRTILTAIMAIGFVDLIRRTEEY